MDFHVMVINNNPTKIHKINVHVIIPLVRKLQSDKTQLTGIILPNGRHISVGKEIISGFLLIFFLSVNLFRLCIF